MTGNKEVKERETYKKARRKRRERRGRGRGHETLKKSSCE
jgi:hypothetical protein